MNKGKICVAVCAETTADVRAKIKRAEAHADVAELRFDCLRIEEVKNLKSQISNLKFQIPLIATYRAPDQGGRNAATLDERKKFWRELSDGFWAVDLEEDIFGEYSGAAERIASFHDLHGFSDNPAAIFQRLTQLEPDTIKIAVSALDAVDGIPVWRLLEKSGGDLIPIAMGEAGKWTRILGLAHGASITYGSLEEGQETAPGQITARDLVEVFRVKELDKNTKVYGVIGDPVSESLSPYMHNAAFAASGINAVFLPFLVNGLDAFMRQMVLPKTREVELNFAGFAVTMPHKQAIMSYLDNIDPAAEKIGAVNTVRIKGGKLSGYNTDAEGFITPLKRQFSNLAGARVIVLGAGGATRACIYALKQNDADITIAARVEQKSSALAEELKVASLSISNLKFEISNYSFDILINATPMGMKGELENETPFIAEQLKGVKFVYDLVTRNVDTPLIDEAKKAGIPAIGGIEMLIAQGVKQFEIWTGNSAPTDKMRKAILNR